MTAEVDIVPVEIAGDSLRVEVLPSGASLVGVWCADRDGRVDNVVLRHADLAHYREHATNSHLGATVGRVANRIAGASIVLDGVEHHLVANNGPNTLHGGPRGWSFRPWAVVHHDDASVTLELVDGDGEQGFPGEVRARVRYAVDGPDLTITLSATTSAPTVLTTTNHAYWNLAGSQAVASGGDGSTIDRHALWVDAERYLLVDATGIPTGATSAIAGGHPDGAGRPIGRWDHWFELRPDRGDDPADDPAARLADPLSGRTMAVSTDQPGLQLYTADGLHGDHRPRAGICLEAGTAPNSAMSCVLRPGDEYRWSVRHRFGADG